MFLLDTNVVLELRKAKADPNVAAWAASVPVGSLFVSVITILELETGVPLVKCRDPAHGALLRSWLDSHVLPAFHNRVLSIDLSVAQRCARLHVPDLRAERDALIAATALVHGMTVVTRKVSDFVSTDVPTLNPWSL
jgi:hypothetical protein